MSEQTIPFVLERGAKECGCPLWVMRCVHFGDEGIALYDRDEGSRNLPLSIRVSPLPFGMIDPQWFMEDGSLSISSPLPLSFPDLPSAHAAFVAAELALLSGGDA